MPAYEFCIICKMIGSFPVKPATFLLQCIGKIPVIESNVRLNAVFCTAIYNIIVELQTFFVVGMVDDAYSLW